MIDPWAELAWYMQDEKAVNPILNEILQLFSPSHALSFWGLLASCSLNWQKPRYLREYGDSIKSPESYKKLWFRHRYLRVLFVPLFPFVVSISDAFSIERWYYIHLLLRPRLYDLSPGDVQQRPLLLGASSIRQTIYIPTKRGLPDQQSWRPPD